MRSKRRSLLADAGKGQVAGDFGLGSEQGVEEAGLGGPEAQVVFVGGADFAQQAELLEPLLGQNTVGTVVEADHLLAFSQGGEQLRQGGCDAAEVGLCVQFEPIDARGHGGLEAAGATVEGAIGLDVPVFCNEAGDDAGQMFGREFEATGAGIALEAQRSEPGDGGGFGLGVAQDQLTRFSDEERAVGGFVLDGMVRVGEAQFGGKRIATVAIAVLADVQARSGGRADFLIRQLRRQDDRRRYGPGQEQQQHLVGLGCRHADFFLLAEHLDPGECAVIDEPGGPVLPEDPAGCQQHDGFGQIPALGLAVEKAGEYVLIAGLVEADIHAEFPGRAVIEPDGRQFLAGGCPERASSRGTEQRDYGLGQGRRHGESGGLRLVRAVIAVGLVDAGAEEYGGDPAIDRIREFFNVVAGEGQPFGCTQAAVLSAIASQKMDCEAFAIQGGRNVDVVQQRAVSAEDVGQSAGGDVSVMRSIASQAGQQALPLGGNTRARGNLAGGVAFARGNHMADRGIIAVAVPPTRLVGCVLACRNLLFVAQADRDDTGGVVGQGGRPEMLAGAVLLEIGTVAVDLDVVVRPVQPDLVVEFA